MSSKRIEQLIEDLYEYTMDCKPVKFSKGNVMISKDHLLEKLDELRLRVPDEIKRCQKMIANRDAILADAEDKSAMMMEEAKRQVEQLVDENEITQQAYYQANEMIRQATEQANDVVNQANEEAEQIRQGALSYTNDMLQRVEQILTSSYEITKNRSDAMLEALRQNLDIVTANRNELCEQDKEGQDEEQNQNQQPEEDDFNFDENTFLDNTDQNE